MQRDTIFRIASITKLVTAVAAMILVEECKIRLDDSIEPWLPELANRRVLKSISLELDDTVRAERAIIVRDLLTYRMGFGSVMARRDSILSKSSSVSTALAATAPCCRLKPLVWTSGCGALARCRGLLSRVSDGCIT
jgi:CubicO group peptidase (beta-lactamase class C family)